MTRSRRRRPARSRSQPAALNPIQIGIYPIDGSGLTANLGNYVFVQDPANATALIVAPALRGAGPDSAYYGVVGAVANALQADDACEQVHERDGGAVMCEVRTMPRPSPDPATPLGTIDTVYAREEGGIRLPVASKE